MKFPADTVLEAKFSPLETLQRLDELVKSVLRPVKHLGFAKSKHQLLPIHKSPCIEDGKAAHGDDI